MNLDIILGYGVWARQWAMLMKSVLWGSCGGGGSFASLDAGRSVLALVERVSSELHPALTGVGGELGQEALKAHLSPWHQPLLPQ